MAHDIYNETAYCGTEAAWHNLGKVLPDATTMRQLAEGAGIDHIEYSKTPLFYEVETLDDTYHHQFPGRNAILLNGLKPLAVVGDEFEYNQPMDVVESIDRIISHTGWKPETALALGNGETTSFCTNLGDWEMTGSDRVIDRLLVTDCVDGRHALQIAIVPLRVVCANTLRIALNKASVKLNLVHKAGHRMDYRRAIDTIVKSQTTVRQALQELATKKFNDETAMDIYRTLFPLPKQDSPEVHAVARKMGELQQGAFGYYRALVSEQGLPADGWAVYNGASEVIEHGGVMPKLSTKTGLLLGRGAANDYVTKAYELVMRTI